MKGSYLIFLAVLFSSFSLLAQETNPVTWSFIAEKTGAQEYTITYSADVIPGWYIYSQHTDPSGPIPTGFYANENPAIELIGSVTEEGKKKEGFDSLFEVNVIKFSGLVLFRQKIKLKEGATNLTGYLEFMACDNEQCLPPQEVEFDIAIGE